MKRSIFVFYPLLLIISHTLAIKLKSLNPDQPAASSGGGDSGEFVRRHQVQEHLFVPLINQVEGDYNPYFNTDIKKYRVQMTKLDKNILLLAKIDKEKKKDELNNYHYEIELNRGIDDDINKIFTAEKI